MNATVFADSQYNKLPKWPHIKINNKAYNLRRITCGGMMAGGACPYKNCCPRPGVPGGYIGMRGPTEGTRGTGLICENWA